MLPQVKNRPYLDFYIKRRQAGDWVILDNGAYEGLMETVGIAYFDNLIRLYKPNVVVLPDLMLGPWDENIKTSSRFLEARRDHHPNVEWAFVPQAQKGDLPGFISGLVKWLDSWGQGGEKVKWVCLPRALVTHISGGDLFARVRIAETIKTKWPAVQIHCLGMANGSVEEYNSLHATGCVQSIDSSCAVWRGWNGIQLGDPIWDTYGTECDFSAKLEDVDGAKHEMIMTNLATLGVTDGNPIGRRSASRG